MSVLDLFRLDGKIAQVTDCKRGIGKTLTLAEADFIEVSASLDLTRVSFKRGILTIVGGWMRR